MIFKKYIYYLNQTYSQLTVRPAYITIEILRNRLVLL